MDTGTGRSPGTSYYRSTDQLTGEKLSYLRRTRDLVDSEVPDSEVLPVINGYWERAEFPVAADQEARQAEDRRRRYRPLRLPADEPDRRRAGEHGAQPRAGDPRRAGTAAGG
jgi:hypothetical protein